MWCMRVKQDDTNDSCVLPSSSQWSCIQSNKNAECFPTVAMQDAAVSHLVSLPSLAYQAFTSSTKRLLSRRLYLKTFSELGRQQLDALTYACTL